MHTSISSNFVRSNSASEHHCKAKCGGCIIICLSNKRKFLVNFVSKFQEYRDIYAIEKLTSVTFFIKSDKNHPKVAKALAAHLSITKKNRKLFQLVYRQINLDDREKNSEKIERTEDQSEVLLVRVFGFVTFIQFCVFAFSMFLVFDVVFFQFFVFLDQLIEKTIDTVQ